MQNTYEENANFEINDQGIAVCQLTIPTDTTQFTLTVSKLYSFGNMWNL